VRGVRFSAQAARAVVRDIQRGEHRLHVPLCAIYNVERTGCSDDYGQRYTVDFTLIRGERQARVRSALCTIELRCYGRI